MRPILWVLYIVGALIALSVLMSLGALIARFLVVMGTGVFPFVVAYLIFDTVRDYMRQRK